MITKIGIGIGALLLFIASGASTYFSFQTMRRVEQIKPSNNVEIRFDHIKKGAQITVDGASIKQFLNENFESDTTNTFFIPDSLIKE